MKPTRQQIQEHARRYLKVVEWSAEDNGFVGSAPPIIGHCCHGETEAEVIRKLRPIVEAWVEIFLQDGRPLPKPSAGRTFSGKFLVRIPAEVHRKAALKAAARGESLNQFVAEAIANA
jgi:predicted HicB family RNase H-like nuclease